MKDLIRANAGLLFAGVATFILMGAGQALFGPALPVYVRDFALGEGEAGLFVALLWVGCFLGVGFMFFKGALVGPRHTLAVMAAGMGLMAAEAGWILTFAGGMVFGMGYGMATAVLNTPSDTWIAFFCEVELRSVARLENEVLPRRPLNVPVVEPRAS